MCADRVAWGQTIFCDDLRFEMGGKISLIGIYQDQFIVNTPTFPVLIPKIVIFVKYYEVRGALDGDLTLNLYAPSLEDEDKPKISQTITRADLDAVPKSQLTDTDSEALFHVQFPCVLTPFQIQKVGDIRVRMVCGSLTTRLGRLTIRTPLPDEVIFDPNVSPPPSSQSPPAAPAA